LKHFLFGGKHATIRLEMPPKTKEPTEADIVFNRANVALAKSQRLIASWLPPRTSEELANAKTQEELEKEDADLFAPVPELLVMICILVELY
jgi:hypothetical protein